MSVKVALLPGDGIGPEVVHEAYLVLVDVAKVFGLLMEFETYQIGGCAIDQTGEPLPKETLAACRNASAILLGAVGGPKWSDPESPVRPEQGLLALRKELGLYANLRPVRIYPSLRQSSPLKQELLANVDLLVVRELTGGIYFGARQEGQDQAYDTMIYTREEVARVIRVAARAAQQRRNRLTSVDKANVLASSRLWRRCTNEVMATEFPGVGLEHQLVDAMAMHLIRRPADFDVIVSGNMFGDILTDEAAMLAGSMGMLPSASLGDGTRGLYEPIHGSAPDIAGKDIANPLATILSAAMMLRHSLQEPAAASAIETAVAEVIASGYRTPDLLVGGEGNLSIIKVGTQQMGEAVRQCLPQKVGI